MVPTLGFEPKSDGLRVRYSTIELDRHMAEAAGFEPTITESKSVVLPITPYLYMNKTHFLLLLLPIKLFFKFR